mmetsp:Transcript_77135/g.223890  ORF Transcript_77135/g.223890 Transcript_77135/m.223890 type:complete len:271 (+) Transcript_77135:139-951(+)
MPRRRSSLYTQLVTPRRRGGTPLLRQRSSDNHTTRVPPAMGGASAKAQLATCTHVATSNPSANGPGTDTSNAPCHVAAHPLNVLGFWAGHPEAPMPQVPSLSSRNEFPQMGRERAKITSNDPTRRPRDQRQVASSALSRALRPESGLHMQHGLYSVGQHRRRRLPLTRTRATPRICWPPRGATRSSRAWPRSPPHRANPPTSAPGRSPLTSGIAQARTGRYAFHHEQQRGAPGAQPSSRSLCRSPERLCIARAPADLSDRREYRTWHHRG